MKAATLAQIQREAAAPAPPLTRDVPAGEAIGLLLCLVQVFGCLHDEAIHARQQQASEKRRGTKSRGAGHYGGQQLISGLWGFEENASGGECPAQWCERIVSPFWEAHWPGYSGRKAARRCARRRF